MYKRMKSLFSFLLCIIIVCTTSLEVHASKSTAQKDGLQEEIAEESEENAKETLTISGVEDFLTFAENCRLDSYSVDLSVVLDADIDLSGVDFEGIPIFCGDFDGGNHSITGLSIKGEGSVLGLFRYVESSAVVHDLVVIGEIAPTGSQCTVGGIAGNNAGRIENCNFYGQVSGADNIGGIVGINEMAGILDNCRVKGTIHGNHFVGGLVGTNYGVVRNSIGLAEVNTTVAQNSVEISDITMESLTGTESSVTVTDIGGIAGFSSGVIRNCSNQGNIGYQKMGYNIAGIAGGQNGYIVDCENHGEVYGRKEVGGIVGHMEPAVLLEYSRDTLQILQGQLEKMDGLAEKTESNAQSRADALESQSSTFREELKNAQSAIEELREQWEENTIPDGDSIAAFQNNLSNSLNGMSESVRDMNTTSQDTLNELSSNLQAMMNQMNAITNTLENASDNLGGSIADVSDLDTPTDLSSKIERCINYGAVHADLNVGGITGAIALESDLDTEEDIQITGSESLNFEGEFRSVILDCENRGSVSVQKQNAGGIVGRMDMGLVKNGLNTEKVEGAEANYVGGIAGQSYGYIRSCNAKCALSGQSYVGGIAGVGTIVTDCRSMIQLQDGREKLGAVLGFQEDDYTDEENPVSGNYYFSVREDIGAIDGVSYYGCAEALEEDFWTLEDLHEVFRTVDVTFAFENGNVKTVTLDWGARLTSDDIPEIPEKNGYVGYWEGIEEIQTSEITFDETLTIAYTHKFATIQSEAVRDDNRPILLVQGEFVPDQKVILEELAETPALVEGQTLVEAWEFSVIPAGAVTTLRYLLPEENSELLQLMVRNEADNWRQVSYTVDGSYLVFDIAEGDGAFCLVQNAPDYRQEIGLAAGTVLLLLIIIIVRKIIRKSKKKVK